ncbi:MAG: hypothetical protein M1813_000859 [Trichoglossum hirsutum]|nr:MAG: hypothetical protein M1813_000859 [Trichoglossum hirsutum]
MESANPLNVYKGPGSLIKFYDPDCQPPLPLVEIPGKLNPFSEYGVRIYAKLMTALPAHNVKSLPGWSQFQSFAVAVCSYSSIQALNMLQSQDITSQTKTIVEQSSGSTVISLSIISRILHQISDVQAYITNKTQQSRLRMLQFFGLKIILFGGPHQPQPKDPRGGIYKSYQIARDNDEAFNPNQYENNANPDAHFRWTGPQILKQLPEINVFCTGMGTGGCVAGVGEYLKQVKSSVHVVGVCNVTGDPVPGPRPYSLFDTVRFPWRKVTDTVQEVASYDSYRLSMMLSREGLICGPSSGMALQGLFDFLGARRDEGTLHELSGEDSTVSCVFLCCDLPYQYLDEYFNKLGEDQFPPIVNQNLLDVDLYFYEEKWELSEDDALTMLYCEKNMVGLINSEQNGDKHQKFSGIDPRSLVMKGDLVLIDLRPSSDFHAGHLPGAANFPLRSLKKGLPSLHDDAELLEEQWRELNTIFSSTGCNSPLAALDGFNKVTTVVCFNGDTSRVASAVLRANGVQAYSIKGGMDTVLPRLQLMNIASGCN